MLINLTGIDKNRCVSKKAVKEIFLGTSIKFYNAFSLDLLIQIKQTFKHDRAIVLVKENIN